MYDKLFDVDKGAKSLRELVDINAAASEKLLRRQADYLNEVVKTGVEHAKTLSGVADLKAASDAQKTYVMTMNQMFLDTAKQNLQVAIETRDAVASLLEAIIKDLQPSAEPREAA